MSQKFVSDLIKAPVAMITKSHCPWCAKAKQLFDSESVSYVHKDIDKEANCDAIQDYLQELTGARTVPRVFIGGKCIGGFDATKKLNDEGKLKEMIKHASNL